MHISLIAALSRSGVIGNNNKLPWHLPADLKYFKNITMGKPIIMGRKTYESIGKPLPERENIVITRHNIPNNFPNLTIVHSIAEALAAVKAEEIMVIGGSAIFKEFLPITHKLYLTYIDHDFPGDTFFPKINSEDWVEISTEAHQPDDKNKYPYRFVILERKNLL